MLSAPTTTSSPRVLARLKLTLLRNRFDQILRDEPLKLILSALFIA